MNINIFTAEYHCHLHDQRPPSIHHPPLPQTPEGCMKVQRGKRRHQQRQTQVGAGGGVGRVCRGNSSMVVVCKVWCEHHQHNMTNKVCAWENDEEHQTVCRCGGKVCNTGKIHIHIQSMNTHTHTHAMPHAAKAGLGSCLILLPHITCHYFQHICYNIYGGTYILRILIYEGYIVGHHSQTTLILYHIYIE